MMGTISGGSTMAQWLTIVITCIALLHVPPADGQRCSGGLNKCEHTPWSAWGACDVTCGGGVSIRKRHTCCRMGSTLQQCMRECRITANDRQQIRSCGEICDNGGTFQPETRPPGHCKCYKFAGKCCKIPLCGFDERWCWPGNCGTNNYERNCQCDPGFQKEAIGTTTKCQLANTPTLQTCRTGLETSHGAAINTTTTGKCVDAQSVFTNLQPHKLSFTLESSFAINVISDNNTHRIHNWLFGIVDNKVEMVRKDVTGRSHSLKTTSLNKTPLCTVAVSDMHPARSMSCTGTLAQSNPLQDGERLCVEFSAYAGGFLESSDPVKESYKRTESSRELCFKFDNTPPAHCLGGSACKQGLLDVGQRVTDNPNIQARFSAWKDPVPAGGGPTQASGIKQFVISLLRVDPLDNYTMVMKYPSLTTPTVEPPTGSQTGLVLPTEPALYAMLLEVHDIAGNVRMARRFVLYDNSSSVKVDSKRQLISTTASSQTNYTWQIHHGKTCLSWTDRYYNSYHVRTNLLRPIKAESSIFSDYDQTDGVLQVSGTPNVDGIVRFNYSWKLNNQSYQPYKTIPDVHSQSFCEALHPSDGQSYTFQIKPVDINGRFVTEEYVVNVDRSAPDIENVWLLKEGHQQLFVHNSSDLSKMTLQFEAFDSHSGLSTIQWRLGTSDGAADIGTGYLSVNSINGSCADVEANCYCPNVGRCETYVYKINLNKLVHSKRNIGQHNRAYFFSVAATNNAQLVNVEHLDILADDSPPVVGMIQEGTLGSPDIDYINDRDIIVSWKGFIDHESGIKMYRVGVAAYCLRVSELTYSRNDTDNGTMVIETTANSAKFSLPTDGYYRSSIIAFNNAMEPSKLLCSDGFQKDSTGPLVVNVTLKHAKVMEMLACDSNEPWLVRSDMHKIALIPTDVCTQRCNATPHFGIIRNLPIANGSSNDTDVSDDLCVRLPNFTENWYIYIPSNKIDISWISQDQESQIRSEEVGFGSDPSMASSPDLEVYRDTHGHSRYHNSHEGIDTGFPFYAFIRVTNKAGLVSTVTLGPIVIDDTPPDVHGVLGVHVHQSDNKVYCSWQNDTFLDAEQKHAVDFVLYRIGSAGRFYTPMLQVPPGQKCPRSELYSCVHYPLHKLQRQDEEKGLLFYFELYVYNMAEHFVTVRSDTFTLPSRFVPGHGTVLDIDPSTLPADGSVLEAIQIDELQDSNVHFVSGKICAAWSGFYHHQNVSFQVGVGSHARIDDTIRFQSVPNDTFLYCLNSSTLTPFVKYYFSVKATCSAGSVIASSDGITIVDPVLVSEDLDVVIGTSCRNAVPEILLGQLDADLNSTVYTLTKDISAGHAYTLVAESTTAIELRSNDVLWLESTTKEAHIYRREFRALKANPRFYLYEGKTAVYNVVNVSLLRCSNKSETFSSPSMLPVYWNLSKSLEGLVVAFHVSVFQDNCLSMAERTYTNSTCLTMFAGPQNTNMNQNFTFQHLPMRNKQAYLAGVQLCFTTFCLPVVYSNPAVAQYLPPVSTDFTASVTGIHDTCIDVQLTWEPFDCNPGNGTSMNTLHEWSLALGENSEGMLTPWHSVLQKEDAKDGDSSTVKKCVSLDVYPHRPLYACLKTMCLSGAIATVCAYMERPHPNDYEETHLYEMDTNSPEIETIKSQLHARYLGDTLQRLHDLDLNYCRKNVTVMGAIPNTAERNITWYLMLTQRIPASKMCEDDTMCVMSVTTAGGFAVFHKVQYRPGTKYFLCAWSNSTEVRRELFDEIFDEIELCGNGFLVDDAPPTPGNVTVLNQRNGFLLGSHEVELAWTGFSDWASSELIHRHQRLPIKSYSFAIGSSPGTTDVQGFSSVGQSQTAIINCLTLNNGNRYYATVRAMDHVGFSVEAVSAAVILDTTPPVIGIVTVGGPLKHRYLLSTKHLTVHWTDVFDSESGIDGSFLGIGSKPDIDNVQSFREISGQFADLSRDVFRDGQTYYAILKVSNKAGLLSSVSSEPFVLDSSPPMGGVVRDGDGPDSADVDFQNFTTSLSCHWDAFYDVHSGIQEYRVGLGTTPNSFDIYDLTGVGMRKEQTWREHLIPGEKYFVTVEACNGAGLCTRRHSDGVVMDDSPPIPGLVHVGISTRHEKYQSHRNFISAQWIGFEDPHSDLDHFEWCATVNPDKCDILPFTNTLLSKSVFKSQLHLPINSNIFVRLRAYNNVGMVTEAISDSFRVDDTPPILKEKPIFILDEMQVSHQQGTQWDNSLIKLAWKFSDPDSPITKHVVQLNTHHDGKVLKQISQLGNEEQITIQMDEQELLKNGDRYSATVTACNAAGLCLNSTSDDLLIDSSPPHLGGYKPPMTWRNIGSRSEVLVTWYGFTDVESRISSYFITVGDTYSGSEISDGVIVVKATQGNPEQNASIVLTRSVNQNQKLILSIWATNAAGLRSDIGKVTVTAMKTDSSGSRGILKLEKHSCQSHFCNNDCTCAVVGKTCETSPKVLKCTEISGNATNGTRYPDVTVVGGMLDAHQSLTPSASCLSGHWVSGEDNTSRPVVRYEWSMGITNGKTGEGIFQGPFERVWHDVGLLRNVTYCLPFPRTLMHDQSYTIYVKAWYSESATRTFTSPPIHVDRTPPGIARGKFVFESLDECDSDVEFITSSSSLQICWQRVFRESQSQILKFEFMAGSHPYGDDLIPVTNYGLATNATLKDLALYPGTRYYFTVRAINTLGLMASLASDGVVLDVEPPYTGVVFNTNRHRNTHFQSSSSSIGLSWHGFGDHHSHIHHYSVALTDRETGQVVASDMNVGIKTSLEFSNLPLVQNHTYSGSVTAWDAAGHASEVVHSQSVKVDNTPPISFHCTEFCALESDTDIVGNDILLRVNLTKHDFYKVEIKVNDTSQESFIQFSIGQHVMMLPLTETAAGAKDTSHAFLSPYGGTRTIALSFTYAISNTSASITLSQCISMDFNSQDPPVDVIQLGPSLLSVCTRAMDPESGIRSVQVGVGTTRGGFQIHPLAVVPLENHINIEHGALHGSTLYVTAISHNHAGLWSVFHGNEITVDHTPPDFHSVVSSMTLTEVENVTDVMTANLTVHGFVEDKESGIKTCYCTIDLQTAKAMLRSSESSTEFQCKLDQVSVHHGTALTTNVRCVNNVELVSVAEGEEMTASFLRPSSTSAHVEIIPDNEISEEFSDSLLGGGEGVVTQDNLTTFQARWSGFHDVTGLSHYSYRLLRDNVSVSVGPWMTTGHSMVELHGLTLRDGGVYTVEVEAVNPGGIHSDPVLAKVKVDSRKPVLSGLPVKVRRQNEAVELDWEDAFLTSMTTIYDVTIGTREGYSDILARFETKATSVTVRDRRDVSSVWVAVRAAYLTGKSAFYRATIHL